MKILIVGCGRVGARLAYRLEQAGHDISVVDEDREAFARLDGSFEGPTFQGSGMDKAILKKAIAGVEAVIAVTGGDNRNLMIVQMARHEFGVQKVIARIKDPVRAGIYRDMGIETLCTTTLVEGILQIWVETGKLPSLPDPISPCGDTTGLKD
jgi:trk system potassium uptake protein TrkA